MTNDWNQNGIKSSLIYIIYTPFLVLIFTIFTSVVNLANSRFYEISYNSVLALNPQLKNALTAGPYWAVIIPIQILTISYVFNIIFTMLTKQVFTEFVAKVKFSGSGLLIKNMVRVTLVHIILGLLVLFGNINLSILIIIVEIIIKVFTKANYSLMNLICGNTIKK
jgi:hypothetical protein